MKKRLLSLLAAALLLGSPGVGSAGAASPAAANPAAPVRFSLPGSDAAYRVQMPEGWRVTAQPDLRLALVTAAAPDGARYVLLFANHEPGRTLSGWQTLLTAAGARNGVTEITAAAQGDLPLITYRLRTEGTDSFCAVCQSEEGWLFTFEFRSTDGSVEMAFAADDIRRVIGSLQPAE